MQWLNIAFLSYVALLKNGKMERYTITEELVASKNN